MTMVSHIVETWIALLCGEIIYLGVVFMLSIYVTYCTCILMPLCRCSRFLTRLLCNSIWI